MPVKYSFYLLFALAFLFACKKNSEPAKSANAKIETFVLRVEDNAGILSREISASIISDTIKVKVPVGTAINKLTPSIFFRGKTMSPSSNVAQDFSSPVPYLVTAENGSVRRYVVVVSYLSTVKNILFFIIKASQNPGLSADVVATIKNDTISALLPPGVDITNIVPTVVYEGNSLFPGSDAPQNFAKPFKYTVMAEDNSSREYTVMISSNATIIFGSADGNITALNGASASLKWRYKTPGSVANITVAGAVVYATNNDGSLRAIDAADGSLKWVFRGRVGRTNIPIVRGNFVYYGVSASSEWYLYQVNATDGTNGWQQTIHGSSDGLNSPTIVGNTLYITGLTSNLCAFDVNTGILKWKWTTGLCRSSPTVVNNTVYVSTEMGGVLTAIDATTGVVKWHYRDEGGFAGSSPTVVDNTVYVGCHFYMYAINATNGAFKWKYLSRGGYSNGVSGLFTAPTVSKGIVYASSTDSGLYGLDAASGAEKFIYDRYITSPPISAPYPVVANGEIYVSRVDNRLFCFDASTLTLKWTYTATDLVGMMACVIDSGGNIYQSGESGDQN